MRNILTEILGQPNRASESEYAQIFIRPYFSLIEERVKEIVPDDNLLCKGDVTRSLTYQIASYAYEKYFKYVYPYEFRLSRENGLLEGGSDDEKNKDFINRLSAQDEWIEYCFEKYPLLADIMSQYSDAIIKHARQLLLSVKSDYESLKTVFQMEDAQVEDIKLFEGDLHDGRCVSSVKFRHGLKLYFKPRSSANEHFLSYIATRLAEIGLPVRIGIPKFLNYGTHSWHQHVNQQPLAEGSDIGDYYNNLGKIQALLYMLGTRDVIPDNVICVGDRPYLIDCESVTHKKFIHKDSTRLSLYLQDSALMTGMLPDWMFNGANDRSRISSVLFKFGDRDDHLPHVGGRPHPITEETLSDFENGFMYACDFFRAHKPQISHMLDSYNAEPMSLRVLLHPTAIYTLILEEMTTPPYLHGSERVRDLVEPLITEEAYGNLRNVLITSITSQIESGNIPYYFTRPGEQALFTLPHAIVVENWADGSSKGLSDIKRRLSELTEKKQEEQLTIIDEAVNFFLDVVGEKKEAKRISPTGGTSAHLGNIFQAVELIEQEIKKRMISEDGEIGFVCRTKNSYDGKFQVCLMNDTLYDGLMGVCLFYRTLYSYSHNSGHKEIADKIFSQLCGEWQKTFNDIDDDKIPLSPLSGFPGLMYLMERFPDYYRESVYEAILEKVEALIPVTAQYDYLSGLAGLTILLTQCRRIEERRKLSLVRKCGERIVELAESEGNKAYWTYTDGNKFAGERKMTLGGFAHGSSSIALALYILYRHTGDQRFSAVMKKALSHDRSFYAEEIKGWVDGRTPMLKHDSGSWCHGATGVALSRLLLISLGYDDESLRNEISIARAQIEKKIGYNLSVCHGSMGNLEILQAVTGEMGKDAARCSEWVNAIANEIICNKDIICGDDNKNSQVGLFMGFAGIGYQLLRFYDWEGVSSIMCLETTPIVDSLHKSGCRKAYRVGEHKNLQDGKTKQVEVSRD